MPTKQLLRVPMFRIGDYQEKGSYTEADLDAMAASYDPNYLEAPVTPDHVESGPAWGWITKVYHESGTLYGDWQLLDDAHAMLKDGRYKRRSIEFYRKHTMPDGRVVPYVKACSVLGAATPHCKGMPNIQFSIRHEASTTIQFSEKGNDIVQNEVFQNRVEALAETILLHSDMTKAEAVAMATAELNGESRQPLQQSAPGKAEEWHEKRFEIAKLVTDIMQENPSIDYKDAVISAEKVCLSLP